MNITRQSIIIIIATLFIIFDVSAKKKKEYPRAEIKVEYSYPHKRLKTDAAGDSTVTVYDSAGMLERGYYSEPLAEMDWVIGDSTKTVLNYECAMARTDYHGRHWTVWFTPEIPVQDGPWKLCGFQG